MYNINKKNKKKFKNIKAVVFDLDGTLVNTTKIDLFVFEKLLSNKVKNIKKYFGPPIQKIFENLKKEKIIIGNINYYILAWHLIYKQMIKDKKFLKKEVITTLKYLKNKYVLGLITSSDKFIVLNTLKENLFLFDKVITANDVKIGKPNIEPMLLFEKNTNIKPENIVYVGDNILDI